MFLYVDSIRIAYNSSTPDTNTLFHVVFFLLDDSPASEFYVPTLRNTISAPSS